MVHTNAYGQLNCVKVFVTKIQYYYKIDLKHQFKIHLHVKFLRQKGFRSLCCCCFFCFFHYSAYFCSFPSLRDYTFSWLIPKMYIR